MVSIRSTSSLRICCLSNSSLPLRPWAESQKREVPACNINTLQQTFSGSTNGNGNKQSLEKSDKKDLMTKDQNTTLDRVRENFAQAFSNLSLISTIAPPRLVSEVQKFLSVALKRSVNEKQVEAKELIKVIEEPVIKDELKSTNAIDESLWSKEEHSFVEAMRDVNESIISFYDTSVIASPVPEPKKSASQTELLNAVSNKKVEEDFASSIFQTIWRAADTKELNKKKRPTPSKDFVTKAAINQRTKSLVVNLKMTKSAMSKLSRTEELCKHLLLHPDSRGIAVKEGVVPLLLKFRSSKDKALCAEANEALALVGYVPPVRGRGIRVLAIDGGGTRGLVAIEALRSLQKHTQCELNGIFDYVCGVSTGALIAALVFMYQISLEETEFLYKEFSKQMFTRNKFLGTGKLVWNHAFYDTEVWEKILRENLGLKTMIESARDPKTPKLSGISSLINLPKMKNFMFRNYNLPPNVYSSNPGGCNFHLWEVIRASSAAPGYFDSFVSGDYVHQDGGLLTNNPTALALHECRLLWPNDSLQCVVSLGTGRHEPTQGCGPTKIPLKDKIAKIVDSATDTEAVHSTLQNLLPPGTYFRLNPYMSEEFLLDEINPDKVQKMQQDAQLYLRKNEIKLKKLASQLLLTKRIDQRISDYVQLLVNRI